MKCIDVEKKLDAFFDGEIVPSKEIETHLENCLSCRTSFENLGAISNAMKQNFVAPAPPLLGEKIFGAFQNHHAHKRLEKVETKQQTEKIGWFGIPRFALAAALVLFTLATISAFQIGRMSVGERIVMMPQMPENNASTTAKSAESNSPKDKSPVQIRYVEVPVIKEKIVEVPVIKEKIVTRLIYAAKDKENDGSAIAPAKKTSAMKSSVENNGYLTQINLREFQPVAEFSLKINKEVNENEKQ